jgi:hypothetical protein
LARNKLSDIEDEYDPRVPLSLERVLVGLDYFVLSSLSKDSPDELRNGLKTLEELVREHEAVKYLNSLCEANCDRRAVLWLLHPFLAKPIFPDTRWSKTRGYGSTKAFFGIGSKELDILCRRIEEIAASLRIVIDRPEFGSLLMLDKQLYPVWRLPRTLRTCSKIMRYGARHFAGNSHIYNNIAKARLTTYVKARAIKRHRWHDEEVANLISSVSNDENYDATAHRMWRNKHYRRLRMLDPKLEFHELFPPDPTLPNAS